MKKILLATGNRELDDAIARALNLENEKEYTFDFSTYKEGLSSKVSAFKPDILVVSELLNGDEDIVKLTFEIKRFYPNTRIVLLLGEEYNKYLSLLVAHNIYDFIVNNRWSFEPILNLIKSPKTLNDVYNYLPDSLEDLSAQSSSSKELFKNYQVDQEQPSPEDDLTDLTKEKVDEEPALNLFRAQDITVFERGEKVGTFKTLVNPSSGFITSSKPKKLSKKAHKVQLQQPVNISVELGQQKYNAEQSDTEQSVTEEKKDNKVPVTVVESYEPQKNQEKSIEKELTQEKEENLDKDKNNLVEDISNHVQKDTETSSEITNKEIIEEREGEGQQAVKPDNECQNDSNECDAGKEDNAKVVDNDKVAKECSEKLPEDKDRETNVDSSDALLESVVKTLEEYGYQNYANTSVTEEYAQTDINQEQSDEAKDLQEKTASSESIKKQNLQKEEVSESEMFTCDMADILGYEATTVSKKAKKKNKDKKEKPQVEDSNKSTENVVLPDNATDNKDAVRRKEAAPFNIQNLKPAYKSFIVLSNSVSTSQMGANLAFALAQKNKSRVLYIIHSKYHMMKQVGVVTDKVAPWAEGFEKITYSLPKKCKVQGQVDIYNCSVRRVTDYIDEIPVNKYDYIVMELDCSKYENNHLQHLNEKLGQKGPVKIYTLLQQDHIFMEFFKNERTAKLNNLDYTFVIDRYQLNGLSAKKVMSVFDKPCIKLTTDIVFETGCYVNKSLFMWKEKFATLGDDYKELFIDMEGGLKEDVRDDSMHK